MIVRGDARHIPLADGSAHCVVTSPPYWGLRDYGNAPSVWGGNPDCAHTYGELMTERKRGKIGDQSTLQGGAQNRIQTAEQGSTCARCGAWRGCLGLEPSIELYVAHIVEIFREVKRVLRDDGTLWLNMGDSYASGAGKVGDCPGGGKQGERWAGNRGANPINSKRGVGISPITQPNRMPIAGLKPKDLCGIPWRVAFALQADGWWLRSDIIERVRLYCPCGCGWELEEEIWRYAPDREIIWAKPNPMPESTTDRPTKAHEYIFLLTKSARYFYDADAVREASITNDERRPYTSEGAWQLDGRPEEQRHGGEPRGKGGRNAFRGQGSNRPAGNGQANRDGREMRDVGANMGRNMRSVWQVATQPYAGAHFATFPEEIARRAIAAGTSEHGCCGKCAAPWERATELSKARIREGSDTSASASVEAGKGSHGITSIFKTGMKTITETVGWRPTCECVGARHGAPLPAIVLDPFAGSGTVGEVAYKMGRRFVLLDLKYQELQRQRVPPMADSLRSGLRIGD